MNVASQEALSVVDRPSLMAWLDKLRLQDGSFMMHEGDGEVDIRGVYCALSVARLTNVFTQGDGDSHFFCRSQKVAVLFIFVKCKHNFSC
jgi:prenyltransferase beta subunit